MTTELQRSIDLLSQREVPAYFLSYEVAEEDWVGITASFGALESSHRHLSRDLDIDVRVGNYGLDSTHAISGEATGRSHDYTSAIDLPVENDRAALQRVLWYYTDSSYKRAMERLAAVRSNVQVRVKSKDSSPDLSKEEPVTSIEPIPGMEIDIPEWEERLRRISKPFSRELFLLYGGIHATRDNSPHGRRTIVREGGIHATRDNSRTVEPQAPTPRYRSAGHAVRYP